MLELGVGDLCMALDLINEYFNIAGTWEAYIQSLV